MSVVRQLKRRIKEIENSYAEKSRKLEQENAASEKFQELEFSMVSAIQEIENQIDWIESNRLSRKARSLDVVLPLRSDTEMWQREEFGPKKWLSQKGRAHVRKLIHEERTRRFEAKSRWLPLLSVVLAIISVLSSLVALTLQRKSADAATIAAGNTRIALELNRKMFNATQAAGFDCRISPNIGVQMTVQISCSNRGRSAASNVVGEIVFTRSERGKIVQQEKRPINERIILDGSGIDRLFLVSRAYNWGWMLRQEMSGSVSLSYGNGIDSVSQSYCWKSLIRPQERSFSFTDCVNFADAEKTTH